MLMSCSLHYTILIHLRPFKNYHIQLVKLALCLNAVWNAKSLNSTWLTWLMDGIIISGRSFKWKKSLCFLIRFWIFANVKIFELLLRFFLCFLIMSVRGELHLFFSLALFKNVGSILILAPVICRFKRQEQQQRKLSSYYKMWPIGKEIGN